MAKRRRRRGLGSSEARHENIAQVRKGDVNDALKEVKELLNRKDCVRALDVLIAAHRHIAALSCEARHSGGMAASYNVAIREAQDRAEELLNQVHACRSSTSRR